jgi:hypothetical protein
MIIRKKLTPDEISPPNIRTNPESGEVEQTFDGGATWTPAPELDPRTSAGAHAPPLTGGAAQCDAAAGIIAGLRQQVALAAAALSAGALASATLAFWLFFIPGFGVLGDIILAFAGLALGVGGAAIAAAFTEEVYDGILCILVLHLDSEGQADETAFTAIQDDVAAAYPGVVETIFDGWLNAVGINGLNNAGALGGETGDCSVCRDCVAFLGGDGLGELEPVFDTTYDSGNDWLLGANFGSTQYCSFVYSGTEAMVSLDVQIDREAQSGALGTLDVFAMAGDNFSDLQPLYNVGGLGNGDGNTHIDFVMPSGYDQLYCSPGATGSGSQTCVIKKVTICSSS